MARNHRLPGIGIVHGTHRAGAFRLIDGEVKWSGPVPTFGEIGLQVDGQPTLVMQVSVERALPIARYREPGKGWVLHFLCPCGQNRRISFQRLLELVDEARARDPQASYVAIDIMAM